jgi:hypothetical protein
MIIILEPQKDTYVTNLKTQNNDGSLANVGHAATLDLFKLYNENKYAKSWAAFKFTDALSDDVEMVLTDADGNSVVFIVKDDVATVDGSIDGDGKVIIGVSDANNSNQAARFAATINNVSSFNNDLTLNMTAYNNSNNELVLKQNKAGDSGDTAFTLPTNMVHIGALMTKFARIDYSTALIKFDLETFKTNWNLGGNLANEGAFSALEAELILKDVTTGISKPKDYELEVYSLVKDFDEGIGKDTIHFSDKDNSNFTSLDSSNNWEVAEYITSSLAGSPDISPSAIQLLDSNKTSKGDEDLSFDVTSYIQTKIVNDPIADKGFLIKFSDTILYDQKSYFVKRLGSRHLINKQFVPQLRIKINDSTYNIPTNSFNKVRYLDNDEDFYLFNRVNGKLQNFKVPDGFDVDLHLKMKISSRDKSIDFVTTTANNHAVSPVTNFKGEALNGVRKSSLNNTELSRYNSNISSKIKSNKLSAVITWFWDDGTNTYDITTENIEFKVSETRNETKYENLITSIRITENDLFANDGTNSVEVYFVDTKKEFDAVKVPYELPSENLGDVYYQVYDIETGNILVDYDIPATKMFYDGEKYKFNLFVPKLFKDLRINFKFKYKDPITNVDKFIFNEKYSVRIS